MSYPPGVTDADPHFEQSDPEQDIPEGCEAEAATPGLAAWGVNRGTTSGILHTAAGYYALTTTPAGVARVGPFETREEAEKAAGWVP